MSATDADVIIIGAGLSGLTAAEILQKHGKSVLVLEGQKRVGGRIRTEEFEDGTVLETGASYIGPQQPHMQALVQRFGLNIAPHDIGENTLGINHFDPPGLLPPLTMCFDASESTHQESGDASRGVQRLEQVSQEVAQHLQAPWLAPSLAHLDEVSLAEWADDEFGTGYTPGIRAYIQQMLRMFVRSVLSAELEDMSALYFFWYMARCGGFRAMTEGGVRTGPDSQRIVSGYHDLAEQIRGESGAEFRFGVHVIRVQQTRSHVVVSARGGEAFRADRVIVAVPPFACDRIDFGEAARVGLHHAMKSGRMFKGYVRYTSPWWKSFSDTKRGPDLDGEQVFAANEDLFNKGWTPEAPIESLLCSEKFGDDAATGYSGYTNGTRYPVVWTMPGTWPPDTQNPKERNPSLLWFVVGKDYDALRQLQPPERRETIMAVLAKLHRWSDPSALQEHRPYLEHDLWCPEDYSFGGPSGLLAKGLLSRWGATLRRPEGRIHWASTETAVRWGGYMDGAVESGIRSAREVLDLPPAEPLSGDRPAPPWWNPPSVSSTGGARPARVVGAVAARASEAAAGVVIGKGKVTSRASQADQPVSTDAAAPVERSKSPQAPAREQSADNDTRARVEGASYAGFARAVLELPDKVHMAGYGPMSRKGRLGESLQARALYLKGDDGQGVVLCAVDFMSASTWITERVGERLHDLLAPGSIILCGTHTHTAPGRFFGNSFYDCFAQQLEAGKPAHLEKVARAYIDGVARCIRSAIGSAVPAKFGVGRAEVWGSSTNRSHSAHEKNEDADREARLAELGSCPEHPLLQAVDPRVTVIAAKADQDASLVGAFAVFGCHATSLGPKHRTYHRDWPGVAADYADAELSDGGAIARVAVGNGAAGDVTPLPVSAVEHERMVPESQGRPLCTKVGKAVGAGIVEACAQAVENAQRSLRLERYLWEPPGQGEVGLPTMAGAIDARFPWSVVNEGHRRGGSSSAPQHPKHTVKLQGVFAGQCQLSPRHPVHVLSLGKGDSLETLITVPGEPTVMFAYRLAKKFECASARTTVLGYAGDYCGYFTTPEEYQEQRYEGASTLFGRTTLDRFVEDCKEWPPSQSASARSFSFAGEEFTSIRRFVLLKVRALAEAAAEATGAAPDRSVRDWLDLGHDNVLKDMVMPLSGPTGARALEGFERDGFDRDFSVLATPEKADLPHELNRPRESAETEPTSPPAAALEPTLIIHHAPPGLTEPKGQSIPFLGGMLIVVDEKE